MWETRTKLLYEPPKDPRTKNAEEFLIFHIPGNPGLIPFYEPFLVTLQKLLSSLESAHFYICGYSLLGFETAGGQTAKPSQLVRLQDQIDYIEELLYNEVKKIRAATGRPPKVIIMGHSVGAYILLEIVRNHRKKIQSPDEDFDLIGGILLFPTIADIAQSPSGVVRILRIPHFAQIAGACVKPLAVLVPMVVLYYLVKLFTWFPDHAARTTAAFIKSRTGVKQSLHLAKDEMNTITDDHWGEEVWGAATATGTTSGDTINSNLIFLWGQNDKWVAAKTRNNLMEARGYRNPKTPNGSSETWKPTMVTDDIPHGFCIKHSEVVAEKVRGWVEEIIDVHRETPTMVYRGNKTKPAMDITLTDGQQDAFIPSYTSLDEIKGQVTITTPIDTKFEHIFITFEGVAKTYVEKIATSSPTNGRTEAFQCFLRLVQPMGDTGLMETRVAEAGKTYTFPFNFVVPERLLPQACDHARDNDSVQEAHVQLPPSLGDPLTAGSGKALMDDMAPDMAVVSYAVKVRMTNGRGSTGKHTLLAETSKKVRVVPAVDEKPPLSVQAGAEDDYRLRKEKDIRKGMFKGKIGRLVMESFQPPSLRLPSIKTSSPCPVTTMATVNLRFDPTSPSAQPPRLGTLSTKLKVATFFASVPMQEIPARSSPFHYSSNKGIYVETLPLSSRCVASAQWEKHSPSTRSTPTRRDSALSNLSTSHPSTPDPSASYEKGQAYYTASIVVPITLPHSGTGAGTGNGNNNNNNNNKLFSPTFHSCLLSRVYALDLSLSCNTPQANVSAPTLHLKLPIQISTAGNADARPSISDSEGEAMARREASEFTWPRSIAPPSP
ncbi:MAG: hypothetical protein Q9167_005407, partial [Letrouitia subvulpina]